MVNGVDMDASQLTAEIRKGGDKFITIKNVKGQPFSFIVVNNIPLAFREMNGVWHEATMAKLSEMTDVEFEFGWDANDLPNKATLKKMFGENTTVIFQGDFQMDHIFNRFTQNDWKYILNNWGSIQSDLGKGILPDNLPYRWDEPDQSIKDVRSVFENPQFRAQHLLWSLWVSTDTIANVLMGLELNQSEMLKILEFMVRTRVIKYPMVNKWDVSDEIDLTQFQWNTPEEIEQQHQLEYWTESTGTTPAKITAIIAKWVKQDNPDAKTYVVQAPIFDNVNPEAQWIRDGFDKFVPELAKLNADVDYFVIENNLWIYAQPDLNYVSNKIDWIRSYGFDIGGSETMIVMGDEPTNPTPHRIKVNSVENPTLEQAKMFSDWLKLYLDKEIKVFGFGGATDATAWTNVVGLENADPLLFDDQIRAKPAYYAIVQVLYSRLP
ncbi:MAG: endo-1,4-beta-xylanase [Chloroflexota bacterium]